MANLPSQQTTTGSFVDTTNIWDTSEIQNIDINSQDFKELLVRLYININLMATVLNTKISGFQVGEEFVTGGLFMNPTEPGSPRPIFCKVINIGQLPAVAGFKQVAHGLNTASTTFTFIPPLAGVASKTVPAYSYLPIPFAVYDTINQQISLSVNANTVDIGVGINRSDYDTCYVTLYYVK